MDLGLGGKRAIVTGASRGIGRAIASTLVAEGVSVAICARGADGVATAVADLGDSAWGEAVDVGDVDAYTAWLDRAVAHLGGADIFVGNVALTPDADEEALWRAAFDVDLMHCVRGARHLLPTLAESDGGAIVFLSSVSGVLSELWPEERPYASMKAALVAHGAQLAQAAAGDGVRVNVVSPGPILFDGGMWDDVRNSDPELFATISDMPALKRMGTDQEVANAAVFLASPAAGYVTGANLRVDGGTVKAVHL